MNVSTSRHITPLGRITLGAVAVIIAEFAIAAALMTTGLITAHHASADLPTCTEEDCSDQPGQIGVWIDPDTGNRWLSVGEQSFGPLA